MPDNMPPEAGDAPVSVGGVLSRGTSNDALVKLLVNKYKVPADQALTAARKMIGNPRDGGLTAEALQGVADREKLRLAKINHYLVTEQKMRAGVPVPQVDQKFAEDVRARHAQIVRDQAAQMTKDAADDDERAQRFKAGKANQAYAAQQMATPDAVLSGRSGTAPNQLPPGAAENGYGYSDRDGSVEAAIAPPPAKPAVLAGRGAGQAIARAPGSVSNIDQGGSMRYLPDGAQTARQSMDLDIGPVTQQSMDLDIGPATVTPQQVATTAAAVAQQFGVPPDAAAKLAAKLHALPDGNEQ